MRRSQTVSDALSSTALLQQAAWEEVLRQVRGCVHRRAPVGRTAASCWCPGRSHGQTGTLMISSGLAHLSDTGLLRIVRAVVASPFAIKMYALGLHSETDEYSVFGLRSICQWTHSIPHSFPEHASAHVVSATSPLFERYLSIGPNRVQVQQRGGVPNYPGNGLRYWWYLHLAVELKFILECPDHASHLSHCSLGQTISSMITWRRCLQGGYGSCSSCVSHCSGNLLVLSLRVVTCVDPRASTHSASFSTACGSAALFLSTGSANTIPVRQSFATNIGVASPLR